jgi:hypothetical protein
MFSPISIWFFGISKHDGKDFLLLNNDTMRYLFSHNLRKDDYCVDKFASFDITSHNYNWGIPILLGWILTAADVVFIVTSQTTISITN